jgi:apolipoprotein N-acyltransferase
MCQIADFAGVYGVSFWVVAVNALVALLVIHRLRIRPLLPAVAAVTALLLFTLGYGVFRMSQHAALSPGPTVMVVQSNYPQSNTGSKGATYQQLVDFHVSRTASALRANPGVDLVIWSETMMPELNRKARSLFRGMEVGEHADYGQFLDESHERLKNLAYEQKVALLVGALYLDVTRQDDPAAKNGVRVLQDRRNVAYLYDRTGHMSDDPADRYDKVHIVPFGEYLPFKDSLPALHKLFVALSPYEEDYFLTPGQESAMTVFRVDPAPPPAATNPTTVPAPAPAPASSNNPYRFVTPICFEDIDPMLVAKMFRGNAGPWGKDVKRADFIVNVTNDGWFKFNEMPQHLQAARFRSIENRAPTARSVNTGISGFIDSLGRTSGLVPSGQEGVSVQTLPLDRRVTLYTRVGDVFAYACILVALATVAAALVGWRRNPPGRATTA